ncbi:hypothetical protein TSUD_382010 [Trifolium subterraneum]|uniref:Uncharacterized protein n=1 Tax=Trifolium subterraneum TaxID=3900 RepID=A0A2Z6LP63_TRISU|nr:hypothetical protein TSUD_382010 [Trifolium subterraneum]
MENYNKTPQQIASNERKKRKLTISNKKQSIQQQNWNPSNIVVSPIPQPQFTTPLSDITPTNNSNNSQPSERHKKLQPPPKNGIFQNRGVNLFNKFSNTITQNSPTSSTKQFDTVSENGNPSSISVIPKIRPNFLPNISNPPISFKPFDLSHQIIQSATSSSPNSNPKVGAKRKSQNSTNVATTANPNILSNLSNPANSFKPFDFNHQTSQTAKSSSPHSKSQVGTKRKSQNSTNVTTIVNPSFISHIPTLRQNILPNISNPANSFKPFDLNHKTFENATSSSPHPKSQIGTNRKSQNTTNDSTTVSPNQIAIPHSQHQRTRVSQDIFHASKPSPLANIQAPPRQSHYQTRGVNLYNKFTSQNKIDEASTSNSQVGTKIKSQYSHLFDNHVIESSSSESEEDMFNEVDSQSEYEDESELEEEDDEEEEEEQGCIN